MGRQKERQKRERESVVERETEKPEVGAEREAKAKARWEIRGTARDGAEIDSRKRCRLGSKGGLERGVDR